MRNESCCSSLQGWNRSCLSRAGEEIEHSTMLGKKKSGGRGGTKVTPQEEEGDEEEATGAHLSIAMLQHGAETAASPVSVHSEQGDPSSIGITILSEIKDADHSNSQQLGHLECSTDGNGECRTDSCKKEEVTSRGVNVGENGRAVEDMEEAGEVSSISADSHLEYCCRICQQQTEEAIVELGCECRGELAKAHRSCIGVWFNTKGSNKCEICHNTFGFGELVVNMDALMDCKEDKQGDVFTHYGQLC